MSQSSRSFRPSLEALESRLTPAAPTSLPLGTQFAPALTFATQEYPFGLATADFNRDGVLDLAVSQSIEGTTDIEVFLGNGQGGFTSAPGSPLVDVSDGYPGLAVGDFNGDGAADLAISDYYSCGCENIKVYLGHGDGTFAAPQTFGSESDGAEALVVGDFDGDGRLDLLVANFYDFSVSLLRGDGAGGFASAEVTGLGDEPIALAAGDLDGDGDLDLVVSDYYGGVTPLLNDGTGTFSQGPRTESSGESMTLKLGDFDGDGDLDVVVPGFYDGLAVHLNDGAGVFGPARPVEAGRSKDISVDVVAGDFDGDGILDLAATSYVFDAVKVYSGRGDGTFAAPHGYPVGDQGFNRLLAADFDGDGDLDLAVANDGDASVSILLNLSRRPGAPTPGVGTLSQDQAPGLDAVAINVLLGIVFDEARLRLPFFGPGRSPAAVSPSSETSSDEPDGPLFPQYLEGGSYQGSPQQGVTEIGPPSEDSPQTGPVEEDEAQTS